jgi:protein-S-isoprenylcysteine O-methyltransferase Ste14
VDRLTLKAFAGLVNLLVVIGLASFLPAGTIAWPEAWVFLATFGLVVLAITIDLMRRDRALLERRTAAGPIAETRPMQKIVQSVASLAFVGVFVLSGLDRRWTWSHVPLPLVVIGDVAVVLGLAFVAWVFRVNSHTSATIEVSEAQRVVTTGPYAIVRHPMYLGASCMLVGVPLALGSFAALTCVAVLEIVIVWRLLDEERLLVTELAGYDAYRQTVRYRLLPRVW